MTHQHLSATSSAMVSTSRGNSACILYCFSWNNGQCRWPFGECRYSHLCSSCYGDHRKVTCPFQPSKEAHSHSHSPPPRVPPQRGRGFLRRNMSHSLLLRVYISLFLLILTRSLVLFTRRQPGCFVLGGSPSGSVPV